MAIFNSYVSLPEGTLSSKQNDIPKLRQSTLLKILEIHHANLKHATSNQERIIISLGNSW